MEKNLINYSTNKGYIEYLDYCRAFGAACMLCGYWVRKNRVLEKDGKSLIPSVVIGLVMAVLAEYLGSTGGAMISSYYGPRGVWSVCLTSAAPRHSWTYGFWGLFR